MAVAKKMDSRELGLVLTEILLDAKDLHYGLWDDDLPLTIGNARIAQQRYTDKLLAALPVIKDDATPVHILDVGCGAGHMMTQMLEKGYYADGVSPADGLTHNASRNALPLIRLNGPGSLNAGSKSYPKINAATSMMP